MNSPPREEMDESDAGDSSEEEDLFGSDQEDLIVDKVDRKKLAGMSQLEREMELTDRAEKRDRERDRRDLLHSGPHRTSAGDESKREGRERRGVAAAVEKSSAIKQLQKQRSQKSRQVADVEAHDQDSGSEGEPAREDRGANHMEVDDNEEGGRDESEADEGTQPATHYEDEGGEEAGDDDLRGIQVRRHKLEKWAKEPFFEETMPGCLVRLAAGERRDADTGQLLPHYRVARIDSVVTVAMKSYKFGAARTSKFLMVSSGTDQRRTEMSLVSNSGFKQAELMEWQEKCSADREPPVRRGEVEEVRRKLQRAGNYKYTDDDVKRIVLEKRNKGQISGNITAEKARLERHLALALAQEAEAMRRGPADSSAAAEAKEHAAEAAALRAQLAALIQRRDQGERAAQKVDMATLNARNRGSNFRLLTATNRPASEKAAVGESVADPFSRVTTRPMTYWKTSREGDGGEQDAKRRAAPLPELLRPESFSCPTDPEAAAKELDLHLDLHQLERFDHRPDCVSSLLGPRWQFTTDKLSSSQDVAGKATLTLSDYRRKSGY